MFLWAYIYISVVKKADCTVMTIIGDRTNLTRAINIFVDINGHFKVTSMNMILVREKKETFAALNLT